MVDLASIPFVKSFGLSPCIKHQHVVPEPKGVGPTSPKTYGLFHLNASIADRFHRSFHSCDLFWAVDRDPRNSQVLLGRPALKDFRINIQQRRFFRNSTPASNIEISPHPRALAAYASSLRFVFLDQANL